MTQLGRYEIIKPLARGGMAELLLARTTGMQAFERHVAIKRIRQDLAGDEKFIRMFLDEARLAASLHHHNIVQVYDVGEADGTYFFAMEYVHGEDLRTVIYKVRDRGEQVPLELVCAIVIAAAAGLHHAHEQLGPNLKPLGLVHRDVSPGNILIGFDGSVKLVDFGLAKAALRSVQTRTGSLKGKAGYMSPEQCRGLVLDRRSDVFALGIVLYELATARRLFKSDNDFLTMSAIVQGDVPPPSTHRPGLSRAIDDITMRALAKDPAARFQTADELRGALERFMLDAQLRTSQKLLLDFMKQLFGDRQEPWLADKPLVRAETKPSAVEPDSTSGIVTKPPEVEPSTKTEPSDSPLAIAQAMLEEGREEEHDKPFDQEAATVAEPTSEFEVATQATVLSRGRNPELMGTTAVSPSPAIPADEAPTRIEPPRIPELHDDTTVKAQAEQLRKLAAAAGRAPTGTDELSGSDLQPMRPTTDEVATEDVLLKTPVRAHAMPADDAKTAVAPSKPRMDGIYVGPAAPTGSLVARAIGALTQPLGFALAATALLVLIALAIGGGSRAPSPSAAPMYTPLPDAAVDAPADSAPHADPPPAKKPVKHFH